MLELLLLTAAVAVIAFAARRGLPGLALFAAVAFLPLFALAQTIDGSTVVGILPVSDKAKANIAWTWLGLFYVAGALKRWIPSHTWVGKALDFITQDTRPPPPPVAK